MSCGNTNLIEGILKTSETLFAEIKISRISIREKTALPVSNIILKGG